MRPVKELKGFKKVALNPGEEKEVNFEITEDMLAFYGPDLVKKAEKGDFKVFIAATASVRTAFLSDLCNGLKHKLNVFQVK